MTENHDQDLQERLLYFGKITASISHEIKNKLAILKEESGLINDLFLMGEKTGALDLERMAGLARKFEDRLNVIDEIMKRLNAFAHSVDQPVRTFDVRDPLALGVALHQRFAAMKKTELTMTPAPEQVQITGNPFLFLNALYVIIDHALAAAGEKGKVTLALHDAGESAQIVFSGSWQSPLFGDAEAQGRINPLLSRLKASIKETQEPAELELDLMKSERSR